MQTPMSQPSSFEIGEEIGKGAVARVVRVLDRSTGHWYAGKLPHSRHLRDEAASGRFRREAELTSRLRHPNLVTVYGIYEIDDRAALLMELVEGRTLAAHLATHGPLAEPELASIARGIASGLAHAHANGIVHRDLKPANILLAGDGHAWLPKIADFGMARASSFARADRGALTVLGTPPYMAPECLDPLAVDPRTDLYALGCILFELATGAPPYSGATPFAVLEAHRNAPVPELPGAYSSALRSLARRLLAKAPGDRLQSAAAVVDALTRAGQASSELLPARREANSRAAIAEGRCAGCGETVLREVRLCFACGLVQVALEPGPLTVFVIGPGRLANKLDTQSRERLLQWLRANAAVGFDPGHLERRIPRLPFALVSGVNETSAQTLLTSLEHLGLHGESHRGERFTHRGLLRNALRQTGRRLTIVGAVVGGPAMFHPALGLAALPVVAIAFPVLFGVSLGLAARPAVQTSASTEHDLPPLVRQRLAGLYRVVESIHERRHRDALRAIVHRVVGLTRDLPPEHRTVVDDEMSQALDLAAVATRRMDELDRAMLHPEFNPADPTHRELMHERDTWSARVLDLTATLDALAARHAAAGAILADDGAADMLATLRANVEALEEVQQL
jgi:tRNA A-37 threonylcarbamoyl transferase component Bud32